MKTFLLSLVLVSCSSPRLPETVVLCGDPVPMFPNYEDGIHIPCNMAPLRFTLADTVRKAFVEVSSQGISRIFKIRQDVNFPLRFWKKLSQTATLGKNDTVRLRIVLRGSSGIYIQYPDIHWIICSDSIDPYLSYRLVQPTAGAYGVLELRQRCLENFGEKVLMSNQKMGGNCFNCHTYPNGNAEKMMIHLRKPSEGSLFFEDGEVLKVALPKAQTALRAWPDSLRMPLNFVYAAWHPEEEYIAFCTNILGLGGYTAHRQYVNLFDSASNILLYHPKGRFVVLSPSLWTVNYEETWPAWSPDGKWLYFCRAPKSDAETTRLYPDWGRRVMHTHFDLCRIAFNAQNGTFADTVQVLLRSDSTKSFSVPEVNPDGRHLLVCRALYNSVPYHAAGNLQLVDVDNINSEGNPAATLNSSESESWHKWSSNGRWLVFSSKRQDGIYATPYIAYFNGETFGKPFVLPQKTGRFYQTNLRSFNLPTFSRNASRITPSMAAKGKNSPTLGIEIRYGQKEK